MIIIELWKMIKEKSKEVWTIKWAIHWKRGVRCNYSSGTYFVIIMRESHFFVAFVFCLPILLRNKLFLCTI